MGDNVVVVPCPVLPEIGKNGCQKWMCTEAFVTYLLQTVLKAETWKYYAEDDKMEMSEYVKRLCEVKEFMVMVENETFEVFYNLVNVLERIS